MNPHQLKSTWFNQDFESRDLSIVPYKNEEERRLDKIRMDYCPIRDDPRRIFEAGLSWKRSY